MLSGSGRQCRQDFDGVAGQQRRGGQLEAREDAAHGSGKTGFLFRIGKGSAIAWAVLWLQIVPSYGWPLCRGKTFYATPSSFCFENPCLAVTHSLTMSDIETIRRKNGFIIDMDGVVYHGNRLLPGTVEFLGWLRAQKKKFLFLTNSSQSTPLELHQKMARLGVSVDADHFYTSALATAAFLQSQRPGGSAFVIGEAGLTNALYDVGFALNEVNPDYVIVGESRGYDYERLTHAVRLVLGGARLIATNPDVTGPTDKGLVPATGALIAPIELCTGSKAYYIGKPNPLIMRHALRVLGCQPAESVIIGDRMDTDIIAGIESEIETVLVLSGVTSEDDLRKFAYRPHHVLAGVGALIENAQPNK